jgi:hypothetical protein
MDPPEVFLNRVAECERMAEFTHDAGSKATWRRMAERWHRCAEMAKSESSAAAHHGTKPTQHPKPAGGWGDH